MASKIICTCGHSWDKSDSSKKDATVCHICGKNNMKNGGWLENYNDSSVSMPEGFVGMGNNTQGRDYSPAWGGQFEEGGEIPKAQTGYTVPTSADSLALYNQSKAVQDYYRNQNYQIGNNSYPVPDDYINVAKTKMNELGKRYNKFVPADDGDNDAERIIPYLLGPNGENYMKTSGNFIERAASSNLHKWGKDKYKKAFIDMYSKLKNPPRGFTALLDMYNSGFMDSGVPVQYLSPLIKPTKSMSVSGTGEKSGNYDELFTYDLNLIKPWAMLTDKEKALRSGKPNQTSTKPSIKITQKSKPQTSTSQKPTTKPKSGGWKPLTSEIAKGRFSGDISNMIYRETGDPDNPYNITGTPPKPEAPSLKKKVTKEELLKSSKANTPGITELQHPNIQLPPIQQGRYKVDYFDPTEGTDVQGGWHTKSFMSDKEAGDYMKNRPMYGPSMTQRVEYQLGGSVYPVNYVPQAAMGGSLPGSVGFTYARTGSIPSEGPYAKKTLPSAQNGGWLDGYAKNGTTTSTQTTKAVYVLPSYTMPRAASSSTSHVFNTATGPVSTATTGQKKEDVAAGTKAMGESFRAEEKAKAKRIAERKAAKAFKEGKTKTFTLPNNETKTLDQMDAREKMYVTGKSVEGKGRFFENEESLIDDINPLNWITGMAGALGEAPYQAKQSGSNMPYVSAILNPLLMGRMMGSGSINPLGKKFWTNEVSNKEFINNMLGGIPGMVKGTAGKVGQSMESGLLSKFKPNKLTSISSPVETLTQPVAQSVQQPWAAQELPGLHLKSTMSDGAISKIVEPKTGLINVDQALAIIGKESDGKQKADLIRQALGESVPKKMDFHDFRKTVQDQLIPLERQVATHRSDYGIDQLGYTPLNQGATRVERFQNFMNTPITELFNKPKLLENQTLILSNKNKFGLGSSAHGNPKETLGHIHFFRDTKNPDILNITQIQSDAFQGTNRTMPKNIDDATAKLKQLQENIDADLYLFKGEEEKFKHLFENTQKTLDLEKASVENFSQKSLLDKNHQERYIQELVNYAGERGDLSKIRLPTSETAAKIQNYIPITQDAIGPNTRSILDKSNSFEEFFQTISENDLQITNANKEEIKALKEVYDDYKSGTFTKPVYDPGHTTILKKYSEQPKIIKKLYGVEPQTVKDKLGNSWYEFDIPETFKQGKGEIKAFKQGGVIKNQNGGTSSDKNYKFSKSKIEGVGTFSKNNIQPGEYVGKVHTINKLGEDYDFTDLGRNHNHSENPNVQNILIGNERHLIAIKPIPKGEELTSDYRLQPDLEQPESFDKKKAKTGKKVTELPQAQDGKTLTPIYTEDPEDPRLKDYTDSLVAFNNNESRISFIKNYKEPTIMSRSYLKEVLDNSFKKFPKNDIQPIIYDSGIKLKQFNHFINSGNIISSIYKKPVQPYILGQEPQSEFKEYLSSKDYNKKYPPIYVTDPKDPRIGKYEPAGNQYLYKAKPTPPPSLKRKPVDVELIKSKPVGTPGVKPMLHNSIEQLPVPKRGEYRVSYYNTDMKDWDEKAFQTEKESDQFANEMGQRRIGGSAGNVTQTRKVNKKENGGWLSQYK